MLFLTRLQPGILKGSPDVGLGSIMSHEMMSGYECMDLLLVELPDQPGTVQDTSQAVGLSQAVQNKIQAPLVSGDPGSIPGTAADGACRQINTKH